MTQRYANDPNVCDVYWWSHGGDLPRGHAGDKFSHRCEPCPPDCPDQFTDELWRDEPTMNDDQHCPVHCNMRPPRTAEQYGSDVDLYPEPTPGSPS